MAYLLCPECGQHNPLEAESCLVCDAPLAGVTPTDGPEPEAGETEDFDLFPAEDDDLPDLLEALKQDDLPDEPTGLPEINLDEDSEDTQEEPHPEGTETPDWMDVVRKRAHEEEDAAGELIRKVSAAQENLSGERRESQHEDFETWIQNLREEARDKAAGQPETPVEDESPEEEEIGEAPSTEEDPEWLTRVRKAHGTLEPPKEPDAAGRSLLDWLVALEDEHTAEAASDETELTQPINLPDELPQNEATQEVRTSEAKPVVLTLSREEREQANLLLTTIADENADRPIQARKPRKPFSFINALLLVILVGGLCLSLFTGGVGRWVRPPLRPEGLAVLQWSNDLLDDAAVVLVFDYQPAYAAELELVAEPVLTRLLSSAGEVMVVSSSASGGLLAEELLAKAAPAGEGAKVINLGYYPVEAYGAYGAAVGLTSGESRWNLPTPSWQLTGEDIAGIVILSDGFENAQSWVEQLSVLTPHTPINLLVTAQAGPLLQPYVDSGQVNGMLAGISDAASLEASLGEENALGRRWQVYQVGTIILLGTLVLGVVSAAFGGRPSDERGAA